MQSLLLAFWKITVEPAVGVAADAVRGIAATTNKSSTPGKKKDRRVAFNKHPLKIFAGLARSLSLQGWGAEGLGSLVTIGKDRSLSPEDYRAV